MDDLGAHDFYDLVSARLRLPDRVTAKVLVNAAINGQGAWGLSKALFGQWTKQSINTASEMLTDFWQTYPRAFTWRAETIDRIQQAGHAETTGGNRRHFAGELTNEKQPSQYEIRQWASTKGMSHIIQGSFAEGFNQTITTLVTEGFNVALPVHDAALIHVSTHAEAQDAAALISETLAKKIGFDFPTAAPRIGTFWTT